MTGGEFKVEGKNDVEIKELDLSNNSIYLKDFEDNLFLIFPKMKDEFMINKTFINEGISLLKEKIKISKSLSYDSEFKNSITKVIKAFQKAKDNVYSENERFRKEIKKPIYYEKDFILIHLKTQCFVKRRDNNINNKSSSLVLTPDYTDECIFFFAQSRSFNLQMKNVFSNTNIFICKREKNIWANTQFLTTKPIYIERSSNNISSNLMSNNNNLYPINEYGKNDFMTEKNQNINNYVFDFNAGQGKSFQIKICSNYINPSSSDLTFTTPIWLMVQSIDRYLNITILPKIDILNNDNEPIKPNSNNINKNDNISSPTDVNKLNYKINTVGNYSMATNRSINPFQDNNIINENIQDNQNNLGAEIRKTKSNKINRISTNFRNMINNKQTMNKLPFNNYKISFDSTDKEKAINNINGLFFIEQYDEKDKQKTITDDYLKEKLKLEMELKMHPYNFIKQ